MGSAHLLSWELVSTEHFLLAELTVPPDVHPSEGGLNLPDGAQPVLELEPGRPRRPHLETEQDGGVLWNNFSNIFPHTVSRLTHQCSKYKNNADDDEGLNGCETISFGNLVGDAVEDVDEAEEDGDEDGHSARNTLGGDEETDPGDDDEHPSWEVIGDDIKCHLTMES